MIRAPHLFTLHKTYTGPGCAICGQFYDAEWHDPGVWLVNGEKVYKDEAKGATNDAGSLAAAGTRTLTSIRTSY